MAQLKGEVLRTAIRNTGLKDKSDAEKVYSVLNSDTVVNTKRRKLTINAQQEPVLQILKERQQYVDMLPGLLPSKISTSSAWNWFSSLFNPAEDELAEVCERINNYDEVLNGTYSIDLNQKDKSRKTLLEEVKKYEESGLCKNVNQLNQLKRLLESEGPINITVMQSIRNKIQDKDLKRIFSKICAIGLAPGVISFNDDLKQSKGELNFGALAFLQYIADGLSSLLGKKPSSTDNATQATYSKVSPAVALFNVAPFKEAVKKPVANRQSLIKSELEIHKSDTNKTRFLKQLQQADLILISLQAGKLYETSGHMAKLTKLGANQEIDPILEPVKSQSSAQSNMSTLYDYIQSLKLNPNVKGDSKALLERLEEKLKLITYPSDNKDFFTHNQSVFLDVNEITSQLKHVAVINLSGQLFGQKVTLKDAIENLKKSEYSLENINSSKTGLETYLGQCMPGGENKEVDYDQMPEPPKSNWGMGW
ncbi:MAG: hypothetical protein Q8R83_06735 [Legionellaceae bacterium]|nr:hypothetical protein [Legionellaceae bacterium]